jgi:uncharacterized protein YjbJ (UPF0337 family)
MGTFAKVKQQTEGNIDEIVGTIQQGTGDTVKGGMTKMRGKAKKVTAPLHELDDNREDENA